MESEMSVEDWAEYALPEGPAEVFARAHPVLSELFGAGSFSLGGGTALAAVWQHRHSTDVGLFTDHATYAERLAAAGGPDAVAARLRDALRPQRLEIRSGFLKLALPDGELSLMTPPSPLPPLPPTGRVVNARVPLERPATILARKLHGRMISNGVLVLRDLYDLAAAATLARDELRAALDSLSTDDKRMLADELSSLPADWAATPRKSGRPVIGAVLPPALAAAPSSAVLIVRRLVAGDASPDHRGSSPHPLEP